MTLIVNERQSKKFQGFLLVDEIEPITGWRQEEHGAKTNNWDGSNHYVLNGHIEQREVADQSKFEKMDRTTKAIDAEKRKKSYTRDLEIEIIME